MIPGGPSNPNSNRQRPQSPSASSSSAPRTRLPVPHGPPPYQYYSSPSTAHSPDAYATLPSDTQHFHYQSNPSQPYGSHYVQQYTQPTDQPSQQQQQQQQQPQQQQQHPPQHAPQPTGMAQHQQAYGYAPRFQNVRGATSTDAVYQPVMSVPFQHPAASSSPIHQAYPPFQFQTSPSTEAYGSGQFGQVGPSPYRDQQDRTREAGMQPSQLQRHPSETSFQTTPYSGQMGTPSYAYHSPSFQSAPYAVYQTPYTGTYNQHYFGSPASDEHKGTWWYVPSNMASPSSAFERTPGTPYGYSSNFSSSHSPMSQQGVRFSPALPLDPQTTGGTLSASSAAAAAAPPPPLPLQTGSIETLFPDLSLGSQPSSPNPQAIALASSDPGSPAAPGSSRRAYHPNPPANRSAWVMWVGNVPSDATNEELWHFFNHSSPSAPSSEGVQEPGSGGGVSSVFLISRSNCAFVNFDTEEHLQRAVQQFDGVPMRFNDPRGMKLVCRIRKPTDDLKAGVGGQRGMGMHTRYIREQKAKNKIAGSQLDKTSRGGEMLATALHQSTSSDASRSSSGDHPHSGQQLKHSSSSGSYASTTSSFLARHFPKRYFILKSLSESDLDLSVQRGVWATQSHNEPVLDQAFQSSAEVYLIFSANKSGEFFGYARMTGAIHPSDARVSSWTERSSGSIEPPTHARSSLQPSPIAEEENPLDRTVSEPATQVSEPVEDPRVLLSPSILLVDKSPAILTPQEELRLKSLVTSPDPMTPSEAPHTGEKLSPAPAHTAPAEMEKPHDKLSYNSEPVKHGTIQSPPKDTRAISSVLPQRQAGGSRDFAAEQEKLGSSTREAKVDDQGIKRKDTFVSEEERKERSHSGDVDQPRSARTKASGTDEDWGSPFTIQWIRTEKLSFQRTRHLRNPWNHDREIKVSRDGTELEPSVGAALLLEWDRAFPPPRNAD